MFFGRAVGHGCRTGKRYSEKANYSLFFSRLISDLLSSADAL
jgi:hypothetical protein